MISVYHERRKNDSLDFRVLHSSEFVENTLKLAGEAYDRRMRLKSAGVGLEELVNAVCRSCGIDDRELVGSTKRHAVAEKRALIGYALIRAARRVEKDPALTAAAVSKYQQPHQR